MSIEARAHLEGGSRQGEAHNCKARLNNTSSRPLGKTEPQHTFSKTSVARTKSSHMCSTLLQNICQIRVFRSYLGRDKTFQASPSKGHLRQSGQNPRNNEIFSPKMATVEAHFGKKICKTWVLSIFGQRPGLPGQPKQKLLWTNVAKTREITRFLKFSSWQKNHK